MLQRLIHGDCLQVLPVIPERSIDLIIADLPFGTTQCNWDVEINLELLWKQYKRVVKPNAAILLFSQTPFDKVLGCSNLDWLRYELIWEKTHATGHLNAKRMPLKAHENILVFYQKLPTFNPIKTDGHPRKTATKRGDLTAIYGKQTGNAITYDSTERYPRSVITFPSDKQKSKLHPTQKPLSLIEYLIKTYSKEGDVVLDNCMGSGTVGVACKNTNRSFIGIEKDLRYFTLATDRIAGKIS